MARSVWLLAKSSKAPPPVDHARGETWRGEVIRVVRPGMDGSAKSVPVSAQMANSTPVACEPGRIFTYRCWWCTK
jgi:hypothetical protein